MAVHADAGRKLVGRLVRLTLYRAKLVGGDGDWLAGDGERVRMEAERWSEWGVAACNLVERDARLEA